MSFQAERPLEEDPGLGRVRREQVDVVEVADAGAPARIALRLVLQRRTKLRGRLPPLRLVEELEPVTVRVEEAVRRPVADVAVDPFPLRAGRLERLDTPLERLRAHRPVREMVDSRCVRLGQLQRRALVLAESAHVDRASRFGRDIHAEHLAEVLEARRGVGGQELDVRKVGEVANRLGRFLRHGQI